MRSSSGSIEILLVMKPGPEDENEVVKSSGGHGNVVAGPRLESRRSDAMKGRLTVNFLS